MRQVQEKCIEQNMDLYAVFIDLTKAFNRVLSGGEVSEPFNISNGVKHGCVLAPILFNLFFIYGLNHAFRDLDLGVYLRFRFEGSVFDLRRLNTKTKTTEKLILEAFFADDCALMAHKESDLQLIVDKFPEGARLFGLTISLGKIETTPETARALSHAQLIKWQNRVKNLEVLESAEMTSIEAMILKSKLRWVGHVIRMDDHRLPKQLWYGELSSGKRNTGRPRKRFKDCVKTHLTYTNIPPKKLETEALDRPQ
ncbi:uncharacterized protein LOC143017527 [Oratosquilla oratoria]|uniref:uncharacterized protein LOC143017527 n=1 Tax=Oratosquilla oratoria TaxID=337810 RepID=UPI003F772D24